MFAKNEERDNEVCSQMLDLLESQDKISKDSHTSIATTYTWVEVGEGDCELRDRASKES